MRPAVIGSSNTPPYFSGSPRISFSDMPASLAPKLTRPEVNCRMPAPLPMGE
jgi:hypothetical protein